MDVLGLWRAGKILSSVDEGASFITVEEFYAMPDDEKDEALNLLAASFADFRKDGTMSVYFTVPEGELDTIREEGFEIIDEKHALLNIFTWKEENGTFYYSCEGFEIDNLLLVFDDDGGMVINGSVVYYRI